MKCGWCDGVGIGLFDPDKCHSCDGTGVKQETGFEPYITCVHCGHVNQETCDYPRSLQYDGDEIEIECHKCEQPMRVVMCVTYEYRSHVLKPQSSANGDSK